MKAKTAISTISETIFRSDLAASLRGTSPLTIHDAFGTATNFNLPDVTSGDYTTVFQRNFSIEDVGLIEILTIRINIRTRVNGNGAIRWQISGNGGNTFVTFIESTFNVGVFTNITRNSYGLWITSIDTGNNKLQFRLQAKATAGTVSTQLVDQVSNVLIQYRQKQQI